MLRSTFFILLIVISSWPTLAEDQFVVTPNTCVVKEDGTCNVTITLKTSFEGDFCFDAPVIDFYQCYQANQQTHMRLPVSTNESIDFHLHDKKTGELLQQATLSVMKFQPTIKRKRRTFAWSFSNG